MEPHDDPDRLDITRPVEGLTSFGGGAHFCLGHALARLAGYAYDQVVTFHLSPPRLRVVHPCRSPAPKPSRSIRRKKPADWRAINRKL